MRTVLRRVGVVFWFAGASGLLLACTSGSGGRQGNDPSDTAGQVDTTDDQGAAGDSGDATSAPDRSDVGPPPSLGCTLDGDGVTDDWGGLSGDVDELACLSVHNDLGFARTREVAYSGVPIAEAFDLRATDELAVMARDGRRQPAQFEVLARWGGVVDDPSLPIRWLEVAVAAQVPAESSVQLGLVRQAGLATPEDDPLAVTVGEDGNILTIDTGRAQFVLDAETPGLFSRIRLVSEGGGEPVTAYAGAGGMGPRLVLSDGIDLDSVSDGEIRLDSGLEVIQAGPLKAVIAQRGHFVGDEGATLCHAAPEPYEPYGYTLILTFTRGQRAVEVDLNFRNECGDNFGGPWVDDAITVDRVAFELPLTLAGTISAHHAHDGELHEITSPAGGVRVEQPLGSYEGDTWSRRAAVSHGAEELWTGEELASPALGLADDAFAAIVTMPWMRFREPQALSVSRSTLAFDVISEPVLVAEARGIWARARFDFEVAPSAADLEAAAREAVASLERGLLVTPSRDTINQSRVVPSLGQDRESTLRDTYLTYINSLHEGTLDLQWDNSKTFGSQLWPDVPSNPLFEAADPSLSFVEMNYWNGSRSELLEYWRSGAVKWAWDWAIPATWLQFHSAYSNTGEQHHGNRNGFALTSGGCGWEQACCHDPAPAPEWCETEGVDNTGHWNRSNQGSDDYTYTHGDIAYVVRPNAPLLRRFAQGGTTAVERYVEAMEDRGRWVGDRSLERQVVQQLVILANCAEFVPGDTGRACLGRLTEIFQEFARDNLTAGVLCQRDRVDQSYDPSTGVDFETANPRTCVVPQQFMQNALMLPFLHRLYLNYGSVWGDLADTLEDTLVASIWNYYVYGTGVPEDDRPTSMTDGERPAIPTRDDAPWTNQLQYTLSADRTAVEQCPQAPVGETVAYDETSASPVQCALNTGTDGFDVGEESMLIANRPQTVAWLAVANQLRPDLGLCEITTAALEEADFLDLWWDYDPTYGWSKGPAQVMHGVVFGLGALDACAQPD